MPERTFFRLFLMVWLLLPGVQLYGQEVNLDENQEPDTDLVVRKLRFAGNRNVKSATLEDIVRTNTNREFFDISRFTPWYFIWKLNIKIGRRLGEPPEFLDREVVSRDIERIKAYYESIGFRSAKVDTNIIEFKEGKVEVSFLIEENDPSYIATMGYSGVPRFETLEKQDRFFEESALLERPINDSTFYVGKQFRSSSLSLEQERVISYLKNNGYASVQPDSVIPFFRPDSADPLKLHGLYVIYPGRKYSFGDVYIDLLGNEEPYTYNQRDTLAKGGYNIYMQKEEDADTDYSLLLEQLRFSPGETFDNSKYLRSVNLYQNLGMLSVRKFGLSRDAGLPDYSGEAMPVAFDLQTLPKQRFRLEFFGLQRFGFGAGAGVTYSNNNLFGEAEQLEVSLNSNFEFVSSSTLERLNLDRSGQGRSQFLSGLEARIDYSVPRLNFPFRSLDDRQFFANARTRYVISAARSNQLNFDINSDILVSLGYEVNHDNRRTSILDLVELDWLDANPTNLFRETLNEQFPDPNSLERQLILEDFRSQFSSILRYTFRDAKTNLIKKDFGYLAETSFSIGGNIPFLVDRFLVTPDTVEAEIPSFVSISGNALAYTQFFKFNFDFRRYMPFGQEAIFAYRFFGGFAHPYGNNQAIPINRRFFAGGASDIRGYAPNNLGPGGTPADEVTVNGGEIKLAAFTEVRRTFFEDLLSADWIGAFFIDSGNVWYGPRNDLAAETNPRGLFRINEFYKQIAVSTGVGVRFDWDYLVVRFDFSRRAHDIQRGWFKNRAVFFTFGIGHSF